LDSTKDTLDRPLNCGDRGNAKSFVNRGPALIVNTSDDSIDMKELSGGTRNENVGIVAIGNRRKRISSFDTSSTKTCAIEADANDGVSAEVFWQPTKRRCLSVDHRNGVTLFDQCGGETRTDSSASNNDDVHFTPPPDVPVDTDFDPMTAQQHLKDKPTPGHMRFTLRKRKDSPTRTGPGHNYRSLGPSARRSPE
jgi:hypothetical protein